MTLELSLAEARMLAINAQGLARTPKTSTMSDIQSVLPSLGAVQLDTISTLARSHELVHYARTQNASRSDVEQALWSDKSHTFEYWSHAACVLPVKMFPYFAMRRRGFLAKKGTWNHMPSSRTIREVKARLATSQATATELGGAKKGSDWWDWSETKEALEWLLAIGDVVCTQRVGWRRIYSLTSQSIPLSLRECPTFVKTLGIIGPSDDDCIRELLRDSIRTLGVGTLSDLTDVHRLNGWHTNRKHVTTLINELVDAGEFIPVQVAEWNEPAYAGIDWMNKLSSNQLSKDSTTTLLSPFDSLVWHRDRVSRLFNMDYRLEAYTPAAKRIYGYFAMPVLHRSSLVARVDPGREKNGKGTTLLAKTVTFETGTRTTVNKEVIQGTAQALIRAAGWVNAQDISIGTVQPASARTQLTKVLATLSRDSGKTS